MNPYTDQIKSLNDVYGSWNPLGYMEGHSLLAKGGQFADQQMQEQTLANQFNQKANPLRLQEMDLGNQTRQAQLPGVMANSSLAQDQAKLSRDTMSQQMEAMLSGYKGKIGANDLKMLQDSGTAYGQTGALLGTLPLSARTAAAKRLLGAHWQPEFEQMDPHDLTDTLTTMGDWMGKAQTKFQQQQMLADQKAQAKMDEVNTKLAASQKLAEYRTQVARATSASKASGSKETLKNTQAAIYAEMRKEPDPEKKQALQDEFNELTALISDMDVRARAAAQAGKPDVEGLGMKEQGLPPAPKLGASIPEVAPASNIPSPKSQAEYDKLPSGTIYVDTDGKKKRKK